MGHIPGRGTLDTERVQKEAATRWTPKSFIKGDSLGRPLTAQPVRWRCFLSPGWLHHVRQLRWAGEGSRRASNASSRGEERGPRWVLGWPPLSSPSLAMRGPPHPYSVSLNEPPPGLSASTYNLLHSLHTSSLLRIKTYCPSCFLCSPCSHIKLFLPCPLPLRMAAASRHPRAFRYHLPLQRNPFPRHPIQSFNVPSAQDTQPPIGNALFLMATALLGTAVPGSFPQSCSCCDLSTAK